MHEYSQNKNSEKFCSYQNIFNKIEEIDGQTIKTTIASLNSKIIDRINQILDQNKLSSDLLISTKKSKSCTRILNN